MRQPKIATFAGIALSLTITSGASVAVAVSDDDAWYIYGKRYLIDECEAAPNGPGEDVAHMQDWPALGLGKPKINEEKDSRTGKVVQVTINAMPSRPDLIVRYFRGKDRCEAYRQQIKEEQHNREERARQEKDEFIQRYK